MAIIKNAIQKDLNESLKARDELKVSVLRMLIGAIRNKEISLRQGEAVDLEDEQCLEVVASEVKKRKDSIEAYRQAGREDLARKEEDEMAILAGYLPAQMSDDEIEGVIRKIVADLGDSPNFGQVMGRLMKEIKGKAEGGRAGEIAKRVLG